MAVGITTTDGKDLDDRYIRTLNGSGPDEKGNVVTPIPPVTSVQGIVGDVKLRLQSNPDPVSMSHKFTSSGSTYSYTVPATGIANFYASVGRAEDYENTSSGEDDPNWKCTSRRTNQTLKVTYNGTVLYNVTNQNDISFSKTDWNITKGDVIATYISYGYTSPQCPSNPKCSLSMSDLEIIGYV